MTTPTSIRSAASLSDVCEPIFTFMCGFNRAVRDRHCASPSLKVVQSVVDRVFRQTAQAAVHAGLEDQYHKVRPALVYFVDVMIWSSCAPWHSEWPLLSHAEYGVQVPGTEFYSLLRETEADRSEAATERLEIFYTCLALGFQGMYQDDERELRGILAGLANRLNVPDGAELKRTICGSESYRVLDKQMPAKPGWEFGMKVMVLSLGALVASVALNFVVYGLTTRYIHEQIGRFTEKVEPKAMGTAAAPRQGRE